MKSLNRIPRPFLFWDDVVSIHPEGQCDCDGGDCACSLPSVTASVSNELGSFHPSTVYMRSSLSRSFALKQSYSICYGPFHRPILIDGESQGFLEKFSKPLKITDFLAAQISDLTETEVLNVIQVMENLNLITKVQDQALELKENKEELSIWLHLTDRCNLRCEYCYLPHVRQDMTFEIGKKAIESAFRSAKIHGYKRIKVKYAGGEALLQFPLIEQIHAFALEHSKDIGIDIKGVILTNGILLNPMIASKMKKLGLRIMISLDGIGSFHDSQRPYANGKGSFNDVEKGIDVALNEKLPIDISVTVSAKNIMGLPELVEWILKKDLPFGLNYYRENELVIAPNELQFVEEKIINGMLNVFKVIEANLPERSLLSSLVDRANLAGPHLKTCGVGDNYMVFDYKGQVSKCQMQMTKPLSTIGDIDPLAAIKRDTSGIINLSVDEKEGCRSCEWKYWCTGGCSLATFRTSGRYDVKSPNCRIYKALYPEAVKLEGLRLMKRAREAQLIQ